MDKDTRTEAANPMYRRLQHFPLRLAHYRDRRQLQFLKEEPNVKIVRRDLVQQRTTSIADEAAPKYNLVRVVEIEITQHYQCRTCGKSWTCHITLSVG